MLIGPPRLIQLVPARLVDICTWYGPMPPLQFNSRFPPAMEIVEVIGGAAVTAMFSVAVFDKPPESVTLATKMFVPTSAESGVPDRLPLLATPSHAGPLTFAKVSAAELLGEWRG